HPEHLKLAEELDYLLILEPMESEDAWIDYRDRTIHIASNYGDIWFNAAILHEIGHAKVACTVRSPIHGLLYDIEGMINDEVKAWRWAWKKNQELKLIDENDFIATALDCLKTYTKYDKKQWS